MKYFISDFHFGHKKILTFERCQFTGIEQHDDYILSLWKKTIQNDDTVYFLGDFGNLQEEKQELFKNLPGYKIMITGNHDKRAINTYLQIGFDEVYTTPIYIAKRVVLSHEPVPVSKGTINIHGHLHNARLNLPNYINANIHVLEYRFLSEKEINRKLSSLPKDNTHFLHEWFAPHYQFLNFEERNDVITDAQGIINLKKTLDR